MTVLTLSFRSFGDVDQRNAQYKAEKSSSLHRFQIKCYSTRLFSLIGIRFYRLYLEHCRWRSDSMSCCKYQPENYASKVWRCRFYIPANSCVDAYDPPLWPNAQTNKKPKLTCKLNFPTMMLQFRYRISSDKTEKQRYSSMILPFH